MLCDALCVVKQNTCREMFSLYIKKCRANVTHWLVPPQTARSCSLMPGEKTEREELYDYTTENKQKAIQPLHSAPEIENSKRDALPFGHSENKRYFACAPWAILYSTPHVLLNSSCLHRCWDNHNGMLAELRVFITLAQQETKVSKL